MKQTAFKRIVLWGTLITSLTLNIFLFTQLKKYYKLLYASELDPIGLAYTFQDSAPPNHDKPVVVFFGDSRAAQWIAPQLEGFTFLNRGIGNQTSAQVALRFEEHIQPLKPDIIILQVCINDLKNIPLFPKHREQIIADCENNIDTIIKQSATLNATVILTTVFPTSGKVPIRRIPVWSSDIYRAIDEVNAYIRSYQADNVIIFDAANILAGPEGHTQKQFALDLLHLNSSGYDALNAELVKVLEDAGIR